MLFRGDELPFAPHFSCLLKNHSIAAARFDLDVTREAPHGAGELIFMRI
jgi:hypothetical protein